MSDNQANHESINERRYLAPIFRGKAVAKLPATPIRGFLMQHRRLVQLVGTIAFVIGFVGGSLFMLQQASAAMVA